VKDKLLDVARNICPTVAWPGKKENTSHTVDHFYGCSHTIMRHKETNGWHQDKCFGSKKLVIDIGLSSADDYKGGALELMKGVCTSCNGEGTYSGKECTRCCKLPVGDDKTTKEIESIRLGTGDVAAFLNHVWHRVAVGENVSGQGPCLLTSEGKRDPEWRGREVLIIEPDEHGEMQIKHSHDLTGRRRLLTGYRLMNRLVKTEVALSA